MSKEQFNNFMKVIISLEDSGALKKGVTRAVKMN